MLDDEQVILDEALENLREDAQKIRTVFIRLRASGMREDDNHHDLVPRVVLVLAMTKAAGMEARRKLGHGGG